MIVLSKSLTIIKAGSTHVIYVEDNKLKHYCIELGLPLVLTSNDIIKDVTIIMCESSMFIIEVTEEGTKESELFFHDNGSFGVTPVEAGLYDRAGTVYTVDAEGIYIAKL